jgi:hypothetical protein
MDKFQVIGIEMQGAMPADEVPTLKGFTILGCTKGITNVMDLLFYLYVVKMCYICCANLKLEFI